MRGDRNYFSSRYFAGGKKGAVMGAVLTKLRCAVEKIAGRWSPNVDSEDDLDSVLAFHEGLGNV